MDAKTTTNNKPSPFGNARPREVVLAERGLDWKKLDLEYEAKKTSSRSNINRHMSNSHSKAGLDTRPKVDVDPLGDVKPGEVLLQRQGKEDWWKIELHLHHDDSTQLDHRGRIARDGSQVSRERGWFPSRNDFLNRR